MLVLNCQRNPSRTQTLPPPPRVSNLAVAAVDIAVDGAAVAVPVHPRKTIFRTRRLLPAWDPLANP